MNLEVKLYGIYEIAPSPDGDIKRFILSRKRRVDLEDILEVIELSNIDYDYYRIEEVE